MLMDATALAVVPNFRGLDQAKTEKLSRYWLYYEILIGMRDSVLETGVGRNVL